MFTVIPIVVVNRPLLRDPKQLLALFSVLYIACIKKNLVSLIIKYKFLKLYILMSW